jgi:hypothetical protein
MSSGGGQLWFSCIGRHAQTLRGIQPRREGSTGPSLQRAFPGLTLEKYSCPLNKGNCKRQAWGGKIYALLLSKGEILIGGVFLIINIQYYYLVLRYRCL